MAVDAHARLVMMILWLDSHAHLVKIPTNSKESLSNDPRRMLDPLFGSIVFLLLFTLIIEFLKFKGLWPRFMGRVESSWVTDLICWQRSRYIQVQTPSIYLWGPDFDFKPSAAMPRSVEQVTRCDDLHTSASVRSALTDTA